jgi:hypothetical protein
MKSSRWIVPAFVFWCCGTVALSEAGPSVSAQIAERIRIQEARVPQIEALAAREGDRVEQWFRARRDAMVQEITRREAARLSSAQRELWVQYADLYLDRSYAPAYFNIGFVSYRMTLLGQAMVQEYLISEMANLLANGDFERKLVQIVGERLEVGPPSAMDRIGKPFPLLPLLRDRATELLVVVRRVRTQVALELTQLEYQRNARLDTIMKSEKDLKEQVRSILEYLRQSASRPAQYGLVQSVGYSPPGGYFCMIEGVDKVLGVGDRIGTVRVLKIDREKVEFAKDGATWAQALGASPQPFWGRTE